mgnify:CR=1
MKANTKHNHEEVVEFLRPMDISRCHLDKEIGSQQRQIREIVVGK